MPTLLRRLRGSLGRQLSWLTSCVKEADDFEWIMAELKAHPERREAVCAQLEASVEPKYDSRVQFNSENVRKNHRQSAAEVFERAVSFGFAVEALKALFEKDRMALSKILMRAAKITKSCPSSVRRRSILSLWWTRTVMRNLASQRRALILFGCA